MKITLNIEVSSAEELSTIAAALGNIKASDSVSSAEVSHDVTESVAAEMMPSEKTAPAKKKVSKKKVEVVEEEEMEEVPSPFAKANAASVMDDVPAPTQPLISTEVQKAPEQKYQAPVVPNAVEVIKAEAGKLEAAQGVPADVKKNVINSLLVEIQAPQGVRASQLPEPFLSIFASRIGQKVDQVVAQFSSAALV